MNLPDFLSRHVAVVYIEKNRSQNAIYAYKGKVEFLPDSEKMSDGKVKAAVKRAVKDKLQPEPPLWLIARIDRTYYSWLRDVWTPLFLAAVLSGIGWFWVYFAASTPGQTVQSIAELLAAAVFVYAGTIAARAFGGERKRNPSSRAVIAKTVPLMLYIALLNFTLNLGGNALSDNVLEVYEGFKSVGLSFLAPWGWTIATAIFIVSGGLAAFLQHRRKRKIIAVMDAVVKNSNLNVGNRP